MGAWPYAIPPDACTANIDWENFLSHAPKPPSRPSGWGNYTDYGNLSGNGEARYVFGPDAHQVHMADFLQAVRTRQPHFQDSTFGFRAAGPALLCNTSYYQNRICTWNAQTMIAG